MKPSASITHVEGSGMALLAALVNEADTTFPGPPAWLRLNIIVAGASAKTPPVTVPDRKKEIALVPRSTSVRVVRVSVKGPSAPSHVLTIGVPSVMLRPDPLTDP